MKKMNLVGLLMVFVLLLTGFGTTEASGLKYIGAKENGVPIYDNRTGKMKPVGSIKLSQAYKVQSDIEGYWGIEFGNGIGYIKKTQSNTATKPKTVSNVKNSNKNVITKGNVVVYEKTSTKSKPIIVIAKDQRYPIVSSQDKNWYKVKVADKVGYIHKKNVENDNGIPVLMYHHLLTNAENKSYRGVSSVTPVENFEAQMKWLKGQGYEAILLEDLELFLKKKINLPGKVVAITFDDGLKSNYVYGYPILKKHGFKATEFLVTSRVHVDETPAYIPNSYQTLSTREIEAMKDTFDFQNHTHDLHKNEKGKGYVVLKGYEEVKDDFAANKAIINSKYVAYPYGQYNKQTIKILKEIDMKMAFTIKNGKVNIGDDLYQLNRLAVNYDTTINEFKKLILN